MAESHLYANIVKIANDVQESSTTHQRCVFLLKRIYTETELEAFYNAFEIYLKRILVAPITPHNVRAERCLTFTADFCVAIASSNSPDESFEESALFMKIMKFLLDIIHSVSESVRFYSCTLLGLILEKLISFALSDELCEELETAFLHRMVDDKCKIRMAAAKVLKLFQNPLDPADKAVISYKERMANDPSPFMRKCCIENVVPRRDITEIITRKTRDINTEVRLAAFKKATNYPKHFKITQKQRIIKNGLSDEAATVQKYVSNVLMFKWLEHYDNDCLALVRSLKLISAENAMTNSIEAINYVLECLFKEINCGDLVKVLEFQGNRIIKNYHIWENLVCWHFLIKFVQSNDKCKCYLDEIVPDAVCMCEAIEKYFKENLLESQCSMESEALIIALLQILKCCDVSDLFTQNALKTFIAAAFKQYNFTENIIQVMVESVEGCFLNVTDYTYYINEILSVILHATSDADQAQNLETALQIKNFQNQQATLRQKLADFIQRKEFDEAQQVQLEIQKANESIRDLEEQLSSAPEDLDELNNIDTRLLTKCLNILAAHLSSAKITEISAAIQTQKLEFVDPLLTHNCEEVATLAMKCYTLLSLLSESIAHESIYILTVPLLTCSSNLQIGEKIIVVTMIGVTDLLLLYGSNLIASPYAKDLTTSFNETDLATIMGGVKLTDIVQTLVDFMNHESQNIRTTAVQCLCKLVMNDIVCSSSLLSRLIIKWFNPAEDDNDSAQISQQYIGALLGKLPEVNGKSSVLQNAVIPTLRTILNATNNSPLKEIDVNNVTSFLLSLCLSCPDGQYIHIQLAYQIIKEMNSNIGHKNNAIYAKMLCDLNISKLTPSAIDELISLCEQLRDELNTLSIVKLIVKFITALNLMRMKEADAANSTKQG